MQLAFKRFVSVHVTLGYDLPRPTLVSCGALLLVQTGSSQAQRFSRLLD